MPYAIRLPTGALTIVVTDSSWTPAGSGPLRAHLQCLSRDDLAARHLRYEDLVAAADVVVSKPGTASSRSASRTARRCSIRRADA